MRIDKGAGFKREGVPVDGEGEGLGEVVLEESCGVFGLGEGGLEEFVVGLMERLFRHGFCQRTRIWNEAWMPRET